MNTTTAGVQILSDAAVLADGGYAVAWTAQATPDGAADGVFVRRYAPNGTPSTGEIRIDDHAGRRFDRAQLTALGDGGFVAVWREESPTENFRAVQLRRFDANGTRTYSRQDPYTVTTNPGAWGVVALPDGGYVRTVASYDMNRQAYLTYIQRFSATNEPLTGLVQVGSSAPATDTAVYASNDGSLLLVWSELAAGTVSSTLYAQRYSADGEARGPRVTVADPASQRRPEVTVLSDGDVAMAWTRSFPDRRNLVITRRFDANLAPVGPEQFVDPEADVARPLCVPPPARPEVCPSAFPVQTNPNIAPTAGGGYVVSWFSQYRGATSWARRYDAAGQAASAPVPIEGGSTSSALLGLPGGRVLRLWSAPLLETDVLGREYNDAGLRQ